MTEEDIAAVVETYRSGWLSQGPRTREFEQAMEAYTGAPHAVAVANCTSALHLMALASGLGPGDEAIVPSLTFVATPNAIAYTGATVVFADILGLTEPWLDPQSVARSITPRTKAIVCMEYGGHPGEVIALRALAAEHDLLLLEDAAHALGTIIGNEHAGTVGAAGAYSFFSNKNLAVGEGGMVVCHDDEFAEQLRLLRSHGMTTLSWQRSQGHAAAYDVVALGYNARMDEGRSALGSSRLARLDDENRQRASLAARYRDLLSEVPGVAVCAGSDEPVLSHHLFTVVLDASIDRTMVRDSLSAAGVQSSVHYPPAHRFEIYAGTGSDLPLTDAYARRTLTLPMFAHMTHPQVEIVVSALKDACAT